MRKFVIPFALLLGALSVDVPSKAASPQVCRGHDEGFEVFTDCYGMALTGVALRNAQIRELAAQQVAPAQIASALGLQLVPVTAAQNVCPPGAVLLSESTAGGQHRAYCAY